MKEVSKIEEGVIGSYVIVRSNVAGVHAGIVEEFDAKAQAIKLVDVCRMWRYETRDITGSISDVAANGLKEPLDCHCIGAKLTFVIITNPNGLEVAGMSKKAYESILKAAPVEQE